MEILINIAGWIGSIEILAAYGLNSYQKITSGSLVFLILNFTGGLFLAVYSYYHGAFANTFLNLVWLIIAIPPLLKFIKRN